MQWMDDTWDRARQKTISFRTPPPPTIKNRTVERVQNPLSAVDLRAARSTVDLSAFFILQARMQYMRQNLGLMTF
jgi:hypothetical protein